MQSTRVSSFLNHKFVTVNGFGVTEVNERKLALNAKL